MSAVFEAHQLSKRFGALTALDRISLTIPEHAIVGLIGPNGSGKTTLLHHVTGLYLSSQGSCSTFGTPCGRLGRELERGLLDLAGLACAGEVIAGGGRRWRRPGSGVSPCIPQPGLYRLHRPLCWGPRDRLLGHELVRRSVLDRTGLQLPPLVADPQGLSAFPH